MEEYKIYKNTAGVYKILNIINNKIYIGSSNNIYERWISHIKSLKLGKHPNDYLQKSWNKYKEESFKFEVIEIIEQNNKKKLLEREQYYIDKYKCYDRSMGYNLSPTAGSPLGIKLSEETKEKYRLNNKTNKPILQFDLDGNFIKKWRGVKEISKKLNVGYSAITCCAKYKERYYTAYGFIWLYEKEYIKRGLDLQYHLNNMSKINKILQLDKSLDIVETWIDVNEIIKNNKKYKKQNIYDSITRKGVAYNYIWIYEDTYNINKNNLVAYFNMNDYIVLQCDKNYTVVKQWVNQNKVNKEEKINLKLSFKQHIQYINEFYWVLKKYYDVEVNKYNKIESKKIIQLDLNMNLIRIWNDSSQIKNIHKEFNIKNINSCLNNRTKTAYNSIWIKKSNYIKDNIDKIKADIENVPNGYKIVQMDLDNNLIKTWNSIAQVKEYGFDTHSVRNCCEGTQPNHKEYKWLYFEDYNNSNFNIFKGYKYNKIIQLSLNGEYIKTWEGTTSICNALGIDSCAINQCCVGKSSSSNGFQWVREKDYINNNFIFYKDRKNKKYKNIIQLTIEGDFIKEWIGAQDVYINLGINGITACCKGKVKSCGGFKWMYKEDYEKLLNKNIEN